MRSSRPMPRATSTTSAPVSSQTLAISLMNEIFVARNALEASLTISADLTSVRTIGGVERRVERLDRVAGPVAGVADHDAVGLHEVLDRRALLEELRAGDVAEALALLGEDALDALAGADRHGRLHHERVAVRRRHRVDDRVHGGEVGVAGVGRRRADRDEQQPRVLERRPRGRSRSAAARGARRSAPPGRAPRSGSGPPRGRGSSPRRCRRSRRPSPARRSPRRSRGPRSRCRSRRSALCRVQRAHRRRMSLLTAQSLQRRGDADHLLRARATG